MVIVDMKLLSGFQVQPSSLDKVSQRLWDWVPKFLKNILVCKSKIIVPQLKKATHRVESKDDHVIMYLQEVGMICNDNHCD